MISERHTFSKAEKLCSEKIISDIFSRRLTKSAFSFPILAIWRYQALPAPFPAQILFSVPKKKIKQSNQRNRIRRQLREIYRLQKNILYESLSLQRLQCAVVIVYNAQESIPFAQLENAFKEVIAKMLASKP
ncbi:MAG: ribonuclease P protein component [Bacteroidia bacterium]